LNLYLLQSLMNNSGDGGGMPLINKSMASVWVPREVLEREGLVAMIPDS
jgi:hypothetical protein